MTISDPPLLEIIESAASGEGVDDWLDLSSPAEEDQAAPAAATPVFGEPLDLEAELEPSAFGADNSDLGLQRAPEINFESPEEHDDLTTEELDTEVEELEFRAAEADDDLLRAQPTEFSAGETGLADASEIDFGDPLSLDLESAAPSAASQATGSDDLLDSDLAAPRDGQNAGTSEAEEIDFGFESLQADDVAPQAHTPEFEEELAFEFGEPQSALAENELRFDDERGDKQSGQEAALDFGAPSFDVDPQPVEFAPVAPVAAAVEAAEDGSQKKAKGKKEKKSKPRKEDKPRPAGEASGKRSVGRLLVNVALPAIVAVPLALYGALWISPDYDFLGVGRSLYAWGLAPASYGKSQSTQLAQYTPPPASLSPAAEEAAAPVETPAEEADAASAPENAASALADEMPADAASPEAEAGATSPDSGPAASQPAAPDVADAPVTDPPTDEFTSPPAEEPIAPAAEAPPADVAATVEPLEDEAAAPAETPESPAEASDPLALPADPAASDDFDAPLPEAEMPVEEAEAPAAEEPADPFAEAEEAAPEAPTEMPSEEADLFGDDQPAAEELPPQEAAPTEPLGPREAPTYSMIDLAKAMQAASQANVRMMAVQGSQDEAEIRKVRKDFYLSLFGLADALTFVEQGEAQGQWDNQRQALEQIVRQFAADPKRLEALKYNAGRWLGFPKRTTNGIMLPGTVQDVEQVGKLYHVKLKVTDTTDVSEITVVSSVDPQLAAGDEAFALGHIVEQPQEQLAGYEGQDPAVVWSGMVFKIPAAGN